MASPLVFDAIKQTLQPYVLKCENPSLICLAASPAVEMPTLTPRCLFSKTYLWSDDPINGGLGPITRFHPDWDTIWSANLFNVVDLPRLEAPERTNTRVFAGSCVPCCVAWATCLSHPHFVIFSFLSVLFDDCFTAYSRNEKRKPPFVFSVEVVVITFVGTRREAKRLRVFLCNVSPT